MKMTDKERLEALGQLHAATAGMRDAIEHAGFLFWKYRRIAEEYGVQPGFATDAAIREAGAELSCTLEQIERALETIGGCDVHA